MISFPLKTHTHRKDAHLPKLEVFLRFLLLFLIKLILRLHAKRCNIITKGPQPSHFLSLTYSSHYHSQMLHFKAQTFSQPDEGVLAISSRNMSIPQTDLDKTYCSPCLEVVLRDAGLSHFRLTESLVHHYPA